MATSYRTPGVYIEEIPKLPPTVAQVETAIPIFIGYTERSGIEGAVLPTAVVDGITVSEAKRITSLLEYETYFGRGVNETVTVSIDEVFTAGTPPVLKRRVITANIAAPSVHTMFYHMQMYFANGGGSCFIVSVGDTTAGTVSKTNLIAGLKMSSRYVEPTLIVIPQACNIAVAGDAYEVYDTALLEAGKLQDRFVVMDCFGDNPDTLRAVAGIGTTNLKYGAAYHPFLCTSLNYLYDLGTLTVAWRSNKNNDGDNGDPDEQNVPAAAYGTLPIELQSLVKLELDKLRVVLPPSSSVVGVYAQVDSTRGVWKAPANVSLNMVSGLTKQVTEEAQAILNVDSIAGNSINVIRAFTGKGIFIWGARTLAGNDNEWKYISVRRFCNMVEESSKNAIGGLVLEANDSITWVKVQGMLENFLNTLWRQGALQGAKPDQAFYVSVGLNKTMTAIDMIEGRMVVEIGLAVMRPAEFIILRFSHKMAES